MAAKRKRFVLVERKAADHEGEVTALEGLINMTGVGAQLSRSELTPSTSTRTMAAPGPRRGRGQTISTSRGRIRVLDTLGEIDAALVQITEDQARDLADLLPDVIVREAVTLYPMRVSPAQLIRTTVRKSAAPTGRTFRVLVLDSETGLPVAGAGVTVAVDFVRGWGYKDLVTGADGAVIVPLPKKVRRVDGVFAHPLKGYWPARHLELQTVRDGETEVVVTCQPIDPAWQDSLALMVSTPDPDAGRGVRVAVVDTGVTPGPGLVVRGGVNTTGTEPEDRWQDRGDGHGTHVAGIISRIAPAAEIMAYRVFAAAEPGADEIAIARAIRQAIEDGCDIINLSLGQRDEPLSITQAIALAADRGVLSVAAAGNDYRSSVSWPAAGDRVTAVSACGLEGSWPPLASTGDARADEPPTVNSVFFANFSNVGQQIDLMAPGVGVISKVTAHDLGVMDGTSMACPAVAGQLARLLSQEQGLLTGPRDSYRGLRLAQLAAQAAQQVGFGQVYEGRGRLP